MDQQYIVHSMMYGFITPITHTNKYSVFIHKVDHVSPYEVTSRQRHNSGSSTDKETQ